IGPDPRNFNQRVSLGRNDLLIRTFPNELHITESRLTDICRRFANRPPKRLIFDRQLREAKRLLLFSDNAVNNIAWQLGFKDPAYFARFFNRLVGCSPSAYRAKKVPVT
ncbi:helix-turn-helix domain-containing protein, partial [Escherichia coli]